MSNRPGIPRAREQRMWAQEMVLTAIDDALDNDPSRYAWEWDDHANLLRQRNRVARLFGLPARTRHFAPGDEAGALTDRLTRVQVAARIGVKPNTIYRWEKRGVSPVHPHRIKRTNELVYAEEDIETFRAWMNQTVPATVGRDA
jgi:hypothetical protein